MTLDSDDNVDSGPECSVCAEHTPEDKVASQQVLFQAVDALGRNDMELVAQIYPLLTNWDAHCAVSVILNLLMSIANMTGVPASVLVKRYQGILTDVQQEKTVE